MVVSNYELANEAVRLGIITWRQKLRVRRGLPVWVQGHLRQLTTEELNELVDSKRQLDYSNKTERGINGSANN